MMQHPSFFWVLLVGEQFALSRHACPPIQQAPATVTSPAMDETRDIRRIPALISLTVKDAAPGARFWVLRNSWLRCGMPSFSNLPEQQRWQIVTYLKSLQEVRRQRPAASLSPLDMRLAIIET